MKCKLLALSLLLVGSSVAANAQDTTIGKGKDNIFFGIGVGGMTVLNGGMNTPTFNVNLSLGKYLTPSWGVRAQVGGLFQTLQAEKNYDANYGQKNKKFAEINGDAMLNLTNLFGGFNPKRVVDFTIFAGPTVNFASAVSGGVSYNNQTTVTPSVSGNNVTINSTTSTTKTTEYTSKGIKARAGATVGFDLGFNCSSKLAINIEGRLGVTPSIFGYASDHRTAEATARLTGGIIYTFGGKKFQKCGPDVDVDALNAEINKYRAQAQQAQKDLEDCRNALAKKPQTTEVEKTVTTPASYIVFFKLGSAKLDDKANTTIKVAAKAIKSGDKHYKVGGYCDKATGSVDFNQKLSEKRAQAVYDALVAEGVSKDQIETVANGGTENMFGSNALNRVVIVE